MKWVNHQVVTGVLVYAATEDLLLTAYGMAGAILPDKLEGNPREQIYWKWRAKHRGWSHWPVLYLALIGMIYRTLEGDFGKEHLFDLSTIGIFIAIGALLHIAEDALCGKVPFVLPTQKIGVKLFAVGSFAEYFFAIFLVLLCYVGKLIGT